MAAEACGADPTFGSVSRDEAQALVPRVSRPTISRSANASAIPTLACVDLARASGVDVMLAGDGGDEIFGGNERYAKDQVMEAWFGMPAPLKSAARVVGSALGRTPVNLLNRVDNFFERASLPNPDRFYTDDSFASDYYEELLAPEFRQAVPRDASLDFMRGVYRLGSGGGPLHRIMRLDLMMAIARNDIPKVHSAARAVGVTVRFPYLDPALIAFTGRSRRAPEGPGAHEALPVQARDGRDPARRDPAQEEARLRAADRGLAAQRPDVPVDGARRALRRRTRARAIGGRGRSSSACSASTSAAPGITRITSGASSFSRCGCGIPPMAPDPSAVQNAPLRVLMVLESNFTKKGGGGAESQLRTVALHLMRLGQRVAVVTPQLPTGSSVTAERCFGIPVGRLAYPRWRFVGGGVMCLRFTAFLLGHGRRYDAWHVHIGHNLGALTCVVGALLGKPVVVKISGWWELEQGLLAPNARIRCGGSRCAGSRRPAPCRRSARASRASWRTAGFPSTASSCSRTPSTPRASTVPRSRVPRRLPFTAVFVGRLVPEKGLTTLFDAWAAAFRGRTDVRLRLVGGGPDGQGAARAGGAAGHRRSGRVPGPPRSRRGRSWPRPTSASCPRGSRDCPTRCSSSWPAVCRRSRAGSAAARTSSCPAATAGCSRSATTAALADLPARGRRAGAARASARWGVRPAPTSNRTRRSTRSSAR